MARIDNKMTSEDIRVTSMDNKILSIDSRLWEQKDIKSCNVSRSEGDNINQSSEKKLLDISVEVEEVKKSSDAWKEDKKRVKEEVERIKDQLDSSSAKIQTLEQKQGRLELGGGEQFKMLEEELARLKKSQELIKECHSD